MSTAQLVEPVPETVEGNGRDRLYWNPGNGVECHEWEVGEQAGLIRLPEVGQRVSLRRAEDDVAVEGVWLGLVYPALGEYGGARLYVAGEVLVVRFAVQALRSPESLAEAASADDVLGLEQYRAIASMARVLDATRAGHERWRDELQADACEMAERQSLCSEFDEFMSEHGMEGREREYAVTVDVTATVALHRMARSPQEAESQIDTGEVLDAVGTHEAEWHIGETEEV